MSAFKIYNCDFGIKYNGVTYDFTHVKEVSIEDPETNKLTRGSNAGNKVGLPYKEGVKDPKRITVPILEMSAALKLVLDQAYNNVDRLDFFCIDRTNGSSKMGKNAILCTQPMQKTLNESAESMEVMLEFETFDLTETHKE